jgi:hypothetical protein
LRGLNNLLDLFSQYLQRTEDWKKFWLMRKYFRIIFHCLLFYMVRCTKLSKL